MIEKNSIKRILPDGAIVKQFSKLLNGMITKNNTGSFKLKTRLVRFQHTPLLHMTKEELAKKLNGNQRCNEISKELEVEAKESGLVVVFGPSDDLMEFRGAINDEQGAYEVAVALIDSEGLLPNRGQIDNDDELEKFFRRKRTAKEILAWWCKEPGYSWTFETDIPHSTFDIVEDGETYCRGIVLSLADVV